MAVTIKQIAEQVGLSLPTVSHVLNNRGRFREETRQRILSAAANLGYVPNATARAMRSRHTYQVGVLTANAPAFRYGSPQNFVAINGLNDGLQAREYVLSMIRVTDVLADNAPTQSRVFRERMLDGVVVLNVTRHVVEDRVASLAVPTIWADTTHWEPTGCLRPDELAAGRLAAEALVAGGAERLLWLGPIDPGDTPHYSFSERLAGVQEIASRAGVRLDHLFCPLIWDQDLFEGLRPYLRSGVGVIAYDVHRARLVQLASMKSRLKPGVDFGLACCEIMPDLDWTWPDICRAGFDRYDFGQAIAEMMIAMLDSPDSSPESRRFPCHVVPGTTACANQAGRLLPKDKQTQHTPESVCV